MSRQLILHVGYPKTGTTALQRFWNLNKAILRDSGLLYPATGRSGAAHYGYSYRLGLHDDFDIDFPPIETLVENLREEMDQHRLSRALLSSEAFIKAANPEPLRAAFDGFDIKILIYLRRHDHFFESGYSQSVRSATSPRQDSSIGSFILYQLGRGQLSYDYLAMLRRWSGVFGKSNMIVRPYQDTKGYDLCADSLVALGVTPVRELSIPGRLNSAMSHATIHAIDAVQRAAVPVAYKRAIVEKLHLADRGTPKASRAKLLSPNDRAALVARYREVYAAIARNYLGQADGLLFTEAAPRPDPAWRPPAPPDPIALAEMILRAAASLEGEDAARH
jgi:hypothetical protein